MERHPAEEPLSEPGPDAYGWNVHFGVLGSVEVSENGRRLHAGGPKQRAVLALLIECAGHPVSTDALVDGVYEGDAPDGARRTIQTYVSNLRSVVGDAITSAGSGYVLDVKRDHVDALAFEDLVTSAIRADDPETVTAQLREALSMWRGHPYADVDASAALIPEIVRLNELRATAIEHRIDADLHLGRHRDLIAELDSLTEEYPLHEQFRSQQMLALYRSGRQAEALRAYAKTRTYLVEEMGLDPSPELRRLEQRILEQDPALAFETGPAVRRAAILVADVADPRTLTSLEPDERAELIRSQAEAIEDATSHHEGRVFARRGSAMYAVFDDAAHAVAAAGAAQKDLAAQKNPMRMAISVGEVQVPQDESVQGPPVTRSAQLVATAHSGQVLLSGDANQALIDSGSAGWVVQSLGRHDVDRSGEPLAVYQLVVDGLPHEFPPLRTELLPPPLPIEVRGLPGYELRERVGSGAFGVVHRAYQPSVGREVAIKIIKPEYANDPDFVRNFEVEAQLVARLEHPHIVPLHDYWRTPDGAYLVMRWLGGGTLADRLATRRLTIQEAQQLLADIGPALSFAHRRGVVHRDVKTSNVLLDDDGGAYLTDFGIASDITRSGAGSAARDTRALAALLQRCVGDEAAVAELLATASGSEYFPDVSSFIAAWEDALGSGDATSQVIGYTPARNPYKGLSAFRELDAADFHGRDAEIGEIIATLAAHSLVVVVGPSGIGKSSVVRAGMIPALRSGAIPGSDEWLITDMLPGPYPYEELASALIRVATEMPADLEDELRRDARGLARTGKRYVPEGRTVLLVIDQFEELFTLSAEDERNAFLSMLAETVGDERSNVRIVLTMRADFFDRPLRFADLGDALRAGTIPIAAPDDEDLRAIVVEPAAGVNVAFEPGLVDHIIGDVKHQPGALPLLEFSLTELFDQRGSDLLTVDAYEESCGVLGALGRRSEAIHASLDERGREAARETFLRLVNVSGDGRDTRRRVRLSELERLGFGDQVLRRMLTAFGDHRLLTFDRDPITRGPTVEVAHEAILTEWPRLTAWIDEHREDLLLRSRLAAAVTDWETADRADTYLLTGGRLVQHEAWTSDTDLTLTTAEQEFLVASRTAEDERRAKRRRTRRLVTSGFGIAAVIALVLAAAALLARNDATARATEAANERETAQSRALAAAAVGVLDEDPELALLLSLQSADTARLDFEGRQALRASVSQHKTIQSFPWTRSFMWMVWPAMSPDGKLVAVNGSYEDIEVWDISGSDPTLLWNLELDPGYANITSFTEDGSQVAVAIWWQGWINTALPPDPPDPSLTQGLHFYDARTGEFLRQLVSTDDRCTSTSGPQQRYNDLLRLDLDGAWFETGTCTDLDGDFWWLIDPDTGAMSSEPEPLDENVIEVNITRNGWLFQVYPDRMTMTNVYTGDERVVPAADLTWPYVSPMGSYAATTENIIDTASGEVRWRYAENGPDLDEWIPPCFPEQTNDAETIIYITCSDGTATVHDAYTGRLIASLSGHTGWVSSSSDAEGGLLVTGSADRTARVWDISRPRGLEAFRLEAGYHADSSLQVVGNRATVLVYPDEVSSPFDGAISVLNRVAPGVAIVFNLDTGEELTRVEDAGGKVARISPDGTRLAVQSVTESGAGLGSVWIHDLEASAPPTEMQGNCEWEPAGLFTEGVVPDDCPYDGNPFAADVTDLDWSPDGTLLAAAAGRSQRVIVWDADSGEIKFVTDQLGIWPFSSIQFSPDGTLLAASSKTGMWLFDTSDWSEVGMVTHPGRPSWAMRFTPDGSELVTAQAHRGVLRIYDTTTLEERDISTGRGQTRDIAISESGRLVALANNIGLVHIIDIETGETIETYPLPGTDITNVEFVDDDRHILVTDDFGPVELLSLDMDELIQEARTRLIRTFTETECSTYDIDPCPTLVEIKAG